MKTIFKTTKALAVVTLSLMLTTVANAADTSIATMNISANVPTVFSVTARGIPGDLDLTPNVIVNNRVLGLFHFKYNANVATMKIKSSTATGVPSDGATAYPFGAAGFKVAFPATCVSTNVASNTAFVLDNVGIEIASDLSKDLVTENGSNGVEEDCALTASWGGTANSLPMAGKYSMTITLTMVSI